MKRKTVLFLDNTYPQAYQSSTLLEQAIGGTEASVVKTAKILSQTFKVFVAQKYRLEICEEEDNLSFIPKFEMANIKADYVIVLRKYPVLKEIRKQFPQAKIFLWLHTYKNTEYAFKRKGLAKLQCQIICNSKTHQLQLDYFLNQSKLAKTLGFLSKKIPIHYCYNPVDKPKHLNVQRDKNKLIFFSSPNKGLQQVVDTFNFISQEKPQLRLYIANPGYKDEQNIQLNDKIKVLGSLPHAQMMQHVAQSLCVFYPQNSFAETFGLIYAEANAYQTPVMAHDIGAAREILHPNNPLIDATNRQQIAQMLNNWQEDFPQVKYNPQFAADFIKNQWLSVFNA